MLSKLAVITLFLTGAYAIVPPKGYVQSPSLAPIISLPTVSPTPTFSLIDQCVDLKSAGYSISCATGTEAVPTDYPPLPTGVRTPPINPHYSARKRRAYRVVDDTAAPSSTGHRAVCYMVNPGHFETRSGLPVAPTNIPCWTVDQPLLPTAWSLSSNWAPPPLPTSMHGHSMTRVF